MLTGISYHVLMQKRFFENSTCFLKYLYQASFSLDAWISRSYHKSIGFIGANVIHRLADHYAL